MADELGTLRALTLRNPWPYFVLHMGKPLENRRKRIIAKRDFGKDIALHVGMNMTAEEYRAACEVAMSAGADREALPRRRDLVWGGIVGVFRVVDLMWPGGLVEPARAKRKGELHPMATNRWRLDGQYSYVLDAV